jgi:mono/diheme cytochrome c family protein
MKQVLPCLALLAFALPASPQTPSRLDEGEAALGQVIYARYCAACHGREGKGDGPVAPGLVRRPVDLTALASKNGGKFPYDKIARAIDGRETPRAHGLPDMPVWGEVFGKTTGTEAPSVADAVKRITHYVWSIQAK